MKVIGLDLTGSPEKRTAFAVLTGMDIVAEGFVTDDEEIIALAKEQRPALVAIDAPLNLPLGLCCLEESCACHPTSPRKGRQCERELSALGIGCYYTTKRSIIKGMVYRAIVLKEKLEGRGIAVIEIYPYASRRRLFGKLPRKTTVAGRRGLQERLRCLVPAIPSSQEWLLSHDALDALLAAYTGVLYLKGQSEALGDPAEGLLHIPTADAACSNLLDLSLSVIIRQGVNMDKDALLTGQETKLSRVEVEHIAELAKLSLTDEEKEKFREQLSAILEYAEMLQRLDTEAIPPTATVLPLRNVMVADRVRLSFSREDVLANAPDAEDGCFKVRAILE